MNPVAFSIGSFEIRWYGIIIALGITAALILANFNCKRKNYNYDKLIDTFLIAFPFAIIGARAYYVIFQFSDYRDNLINVFNIRQGGLAIHGGVIFALASAYIYCKRKKLDFWEMADIAAPSLILGQAIGRWGNFFNGEAHGGPVTYDFISKFPSFIQKGMYIDGTYYHPTFLYESMWNLVVCLILIYLLNKKLKKGTIIFTYVGLYSLGRFFIEGMRTDSLMFGIIRMAQLVSLAGIVLCIGFYIYTYRKKV
ncbi:prolipoprotein diacylglyceryl transferase [Clostridium thailandense]|uniref:Phosphatidylglycerol--prolipoprotein diacylglyceryl transferase n=1 Tax=Clostridium thailandense TaxID=2794346 RepID=A0A949WQN9_9CLOT|nr:prolipoprotein diacylglyceryl transferase [Clostridium thailandense]MBV7273006.1 prolipoprotein diacylglyceryl transferase [Clostridium thailandense]MCH5135670.1 prolipoprotein diacylglyceryl transferase [Clostridiaceae bacterium UIB06]